MGRSLAFVVAAVGALVALALVDNDRETDPSSASLAGAPEAEAAATSGDYASLGGDSLTQTLVGCISAFEPAGDIPPAPPLTPAGVEEIGERVEELRELEFEKAADIRFLDDEELDAEIERLTEQTSNDELARSTEAVLEMLGAIPAGSDLAELSKEALEGQVLGLYVPPTRDLLVLRSGKGGSLEAITVAHELDHALTDEALELPVPDRERAGRGDSDLAALALVEGDATLLMVQYMLGYISLEDQLALGDDPTLATGGEGFEDLPYILQRQLVYPYEAGTEYVCNLYEQGGWEAVDAAYDDPPASTAALINPDAEPPLDYLPPPVQLDEFDDTWKKTLDDQIGAAELMWLFEAPGDDPAAALPGAREAVAGWRYGHLELWEREDGRALSMQLVGTGDDDPLCGATIAWYRAAFGDAEVGRGAGEATTFESPEQSAAIRCSADAVLVGIGPTPDVAESLAS